MQRESFSRAEAGELGGAGDGRQRRGPEVRDPRRRPPGAGRLHRSLRALARGRARAGRADRRRNPPLRGRPSGRGADDAKAFDELGAERVYGEIPAFNEAAKRTVAGLGWHHVETLADHDERDGERFDLEIWAVLPDDFRKPRRTFLRPPGPSSWRTAARRGLRRLLPFAPLPRRRRHPHAEGRGRRGRAARAPDRSRDPPKQRRSRRDLSLRLSGLGPRRESGALPTEPPRCCSGGSDPDPRSGRDRLRADRSGQRVLPPHARRSARARRGQDPHRGPGRRPDAAAQAALDDRNQINKNRRNGYEVSIVAGPSPTPPSAPGSSPPTRDDAARRAAERYFFGSDYFDRILESVAPGSPSPSPPTERSRRHRSPSPATASSTTT